MNGRLTYLTLAVEEPDAADAFYQRVFQWPAPVVRSGARFFALPGITVALLPRPDWEQFTGCARGADVRPTALYSWNVGSRKEAEAVLRRAVEHGGSVCKPVHLLPWGGWAGLLETPDGHLWEVVWNPRLENQGQKIICEPTGAD